MAKTIFLSILLAISLRAYSQQAEKHPSMYHAIADTSSSTIREISTHELMKIMEGGLALILDTRPHEEWSYGHLPGALNVAPKPGMPISLYTSDVHEVLRLVNGNKNKALVLYCNGPFCEKSKRVSEDLIKEGFTNVVRYQLGTPYWRTTGNVVQIEKEGLIYFSNDPTAVWVDAREEAAFKTETIKGTVTIPP